MSEPADFFIVGGTLRAQAPCYVTRPADHSLFESVLSGEFCYVLVSRQMGKSSLMIRTARRLEQQQIRSVIIDLTSIGTVSIDEWYLGLLSRIRTSLRLAVDVAAWWSDHQHLSVPQRFMEFLRHIALAEVETPVVIFVDEIDTTLNLDFRDDFFAAIRAIYNERATTPIYGRLTFVLLGVATPTDLIQDRDRTPFNIGRRIVLQEFNYADAQPLRDGLDEKHGGQGEIVLRRIFDWTNGHPYLTQKLCQAATLAPTTIWDTAGVDALVQANFLADEVQDDNLKFVQNRIQSSPRPERRRILRLYQRVRSGKVVPDDDRLPTQNYLTLFGLVRVEGGRLQVRNEIYRHVFDRDWINATMPTNTARNVAVALSLAAVLVLGLFFYVANNRQTELQIQANSYKQAFLQASTSAGRADALARLFNLPSDYKDAKPTEAAGVRAMGRSLFYSLAPDDQLDLLNARGVGAQQQQQIITVIQSVYQSLNTVGDGPDNDLGVMDAMIAAMTVAQTSPDVQVISELKSWKRARDIASEARLSKKTETYTTAISLFNQVIEAHPSNLAARYDRALILTARSQYAAALSDLDIVLKDAKAEPAVQATNELTVTNRFISTGQILKTVRERLRAETQLQIALQSNLNDYPELSKEASDILAELAKSQTTTAIALAATQTQAAVAAAQASANQHATQTAIAAQTAIAQAIANQDATAQAITNQDATQAAIVAQTAAARASQTAIAQLHTLAQNETATADALAAQAAADLQATQAAIAQATATSGNPTGEPVVLEPLACSEEASAKSAGGPATTIEFVNATSQRVKVYWLDFQGHRVLYFSLDAGNSHIQPTFLPHPWVVTDASDQCLALFRPAVAPGRATITAP